MRPMTIRFTRRADGDVVLRCDRADGTSTWQRQQGRHAAFFALHDLTHYAVESTLDCRRGFFGLIAEGWEISDTEGKSARGPLPPETVAVEHMVGFLDVERASGAISNADAWLAHAALARIDLRCVTGRDITDAGLDAIRARRAELFGQWATLEAGGQIELSFPASFAER